MAEWQDIPACEVDITALDFETTGTVPGWPVEPWQIGIVAVRGGQVLAESRLSQWIRIDPTRPFNPFAPGRHRQVRAELAVAPTLADVWRDYSRTWLMGRPLVAHNVGTERTVLRRAAPLHPLSPWIDTLTLVRKAYPKLGTYGLDALISTLGLKGRLHGVCPEGEPHDACYDACACGVLLEHLLALSSWQGVTLGALALKPLF